MPLRFLPLFAQSGGSLGPGGKRDRTPRRRSRFLWHVRRSMLSQRRLGQRQIRSRPALFPTHQLGSTKVRGANLLSDWSSLAFVGRIAVVLEDW